MRKWILALFTLPLIAIGCANKDNNCGNTFQVLWPSATGEYRFEDVALSTLPDPYELSGDAAKIYFQSGMTLAGFDGPVARPQMTSTNGVCIPMDVESSAAVSVYAQFEKIMHYEIKLGTADMLPWPRRVGLDISLLTPDGNGHNNAHYFSEGDAIAILPYSLGGLPLGLNHGVIAHEHFHAHFQAQVMNELNRVLVARPAGFAGFTGSLDFLFYSLMPGVKPTEDIDDADLSTNRGLNNFVLRAWNEGLADLYGAIYTSNPGFFVDSLPMLGNARTLTEELKPLGTRQDLINYLRTVQSPSKLVGYSYVQGAQVARLLYRLANSGVETPQIFMARILRNLKTIPPAILPKYDRTILDTEVIMPQLLEGFQFNAEACDHLNISISKDLSLRSFSQCR